MEVDLVVAFVVRVLDEGPMLIELENGLDREDTAEDTHCCEAIVNTML